MDGVIEYEEACKNLQRQRHISKLRFAGWIRGRNVEVEIQLAFGESCEFNRA